MSSTPELEYRVRHEGGDRHYGFNYGELKERFETWRDCSDRKFKSDIKDILHFACFVSWFKGDGQDALSDIGIVHELVHYLHFPDEMDIKELRELFNRKLELA